MREPSAIHSAFETASGRTTARTRYALALAATCALVAACGESELGPQASGPAMGAAAASLSSDALPPDNHAPKIVAARLVPPRPAAGQQVRVEVDATDRDGDAVSFTYQWSLGGRALASETTERTVLRDARKGDLISVRVVATDGLSQSDPREIKVRIGNRPPEIDGIVFEPPGEMVAGRKLHARALVEDPDGDRIDLDFRWLVNGVDRGDGSSDFSTAGLSRGDKLQVRVRASDGDERSDEFETPVFELSNAAPVIDFQAIPAQPDGGLSYRVPASDPDGDSLRFRLREAPEGMTIVATRGDLEWTPRSDQIGTFRVVVEVDDLHGGVSQQAFSMTVGDDSTPASPAR